MLSSRASLSSCSRFAATRDRVSSLAPLTCTATLAPAGMFSSARAVRTAEIAPISQSISATAAPVSPGRSIASARAP